MVKYELLPERLKDYIKENNCSIKQLKETIEYILNRKSSKFYVRVHNFTLEGIPKTIELDPRNVMSEDEIKKEFEMSYEVITK